MFENDPAERETQGTNMGKQQVVSRPNGWDVDEKVYRDHKYNKYNKSNESSSYDNNSGY